MVRHKCSETELSSTHQPSRRSNTVDCASYDGSHTIGAIDMTAKDSRYSQNTSVERDQESRCTVGGHCGMLLGDRGVGLCAICPYQASSCAQPRGLRLQSRRSRWPTSAC